MEGFERPRPREPGAEEQEDAELSLEELEAEAGETLPDRQAMSLIDASVTIPANPSLAARLVLAAEGSERPGATGFELRGPFELARGDELPEAPIA